MLSTRIVCDAGGTALAEQVAALLASAGLVAPVVYKDRYPIGDALCRFLANVASPESATLLVISASAEASHWALPELMANAHLYPNVLPITVSSVAGLVPQGRAVLSEANVSKESLLQALSGARDAGA